MNVRGGVLQDLAKKVGFPFEESELSPSLRRRVGELEAMYQKYWARQDQAAVLKKERQDSAALMIIVGALGVIMTAFGAFVWPLFIGVPLLIGTIIIYFTVFKLKGAQFTTWTYEISQMQSSAETKRASLSEEVYSELSSVHSARTSAQNVASPSQLIRETIVKEVVMIPCNYCRALMPQTSVFCPNCGARPKG